MEVGAFLLLNGTLSTPHRYITTEDGAVIKRMYDNKLYSLNPQYPYGERASTIMYRSSERCSEPSVLRPFLLRNER